MVDQADGEAVAWSPAVVSLLRELLPSAYRDVMLQIAAEVPAYADPFEAGGGEFMALVENGIDQTMHRFVDRIADASQPEDPLWRDVIQELGRSAAREGRQLDVLLAAFRVGARIAWRRIAAGGTAAGISPDELYRLAEELFLYVDELSSMSAEGYGAQRADQVGERRRVRRALAELIVAPVPPDAAALAEAAREAHWPIPDRIAVIAARAEDPDRLAGRLGPDVLATGADGIATVVVPDPDAPGRGLSLRSAFAEAAAAALGPTVPVPGGAASAARAHHALALIDEGILPGDGLMICAEHLLTLLVHRDEALLADIRASTLRPLDSVGANQREKLVQTLRAYLDHEGRMDPTAHALGVHPQTVRYRVAQLRELLGAALEDPDRRLLLQVALRAG
jgi:hypothetical protein